MPNEFRNYTPAVPLGRNAGADFMNCDVVDHLCRLPAACGTTIAVPLYFFVLFKAEPKVPGIYLVK